VRLGQLRVDLQRAAVQRDRGEEPEEPDRRLFFGASPGRSPLRSILPGNGALVTPPLDPSDPKNNLRSDADRAAQRPDAAKTTSGPKPRAPNNLRSGSSQNNLRSEAARSRGSHGPTRGRAPRLQRAAEQARAALGAETAKAALRRPRLSSLSGGDKGDRTPDLVNAIHALSQLSYIPVEGTGSTY
jgi:hypothetical protein